VLTDGGVSQEVAVSVAAVPSVLTDGEVYQEAAAPVAAVPTVLTDGEAPQEVAVSAAAEPSMFTNGELYSVTPPADASKQAAPAPAPVDVSSVATGTTEAAATEALGLENDGSTGRSVCAVVKEAIATEEEEEDGDDGPPPLEPETPKGDGSSANAFRLEQPGARAEAPCQMTTCLDNNKTSTSHHVDGRICHLITVAFAAGRLFIVIHCCGHCAVLSGQSAFKMQFIRIYSTG
jgi:hypothetical protein